MAIRNRRDGVGRARPTCPPEDGATCLAADGRTAAPCRGRIRDPIHAMRTDGERLTLCLRAGVGGDTAFRYHEKDGIGAFYWSDEGLVMRSPPRPIVTCCCASRSSSTSRPLKRAPKRKSCPPRASPVESAQPAPGIKRDFVMS